MGGKKSQLARDLKVLIEKAVKGRERRTGFTSRQYDLLKSDRLGAKTGKVPMYKGCQCCYLSVMLSPGKPCRNWKGFCKDCRENHQYLIENEISYGFFQLFSRYIANKHCK